MPMVTDVIGNYGNVCMTIKNNGVVVNEKIYHNTITTDGIMNLLRVLCLDYTSFITKIGIVYSLNGNQYTQTYDNFSSIRVVQPTTEGSSPYAEFRFYLSTADLVGTQLVGAKLYTKDNTNTDIIFSEVDTEDVISGTTTPVISSITKTNAISVLYTWNIGLTSAFVSSIN